VGNASIGGIGRGPEA